MAICSASRGVGRPSYLPFVLCGVLALYVVSVSGHGGNLKLGEQCIPWTCTCHFNGVYYDEGDEWDAPGDPCTRYKCKKNGFFLPIKSGCSFKGVCHARNTTWNEGCFQYKCHSDYRTSAYQLEKAACVWRDGNCYAVGERATERCDVYECQIDDGCYVMNKVKSECETGHAEPKCKPLYSFWQDECALYQCVGESKERTASRVLTHAHSVMLWPRGYYALPEPEVGCPHIGESVWMEGSHLHFGDGCNFVSNPFNLKGEYNSTGFHHHFCVHHDVDDKTIIPVYQTYWGPGRYCIYKYNGTCPSGFTEGFVQMTNNNIYNVTNITVDHFPAFNSTFNSTSFNFTAHNLTGVNVTTGAVPDGNFTEDVTRMEFCCRKDGHSDHPIVLPVKHAFYLFMAENETECQAVQGMHHQKEFWSFCDIDDGIYREMNGSLPLIKTGDNNTMVFLCYYWPIGCGCTVEDEAVIAIGDEIEKKCVTWECQTAFGHNYLNVTKGGCYDDVNEKCRLEDEVWTDMIGEMCQDRKCVRVTDEKDNLNITFKIIDVSKGCRDEEDKCYSLNTTIEHGCYHTQCQVDLATGKTAFKVTLAGCSDGHGNCIADGANVTHKCVTMRCDRSASKCGLVVAKGRCLANGKCYDIGETLKHYCSEYICKEIIKSHSRTYKFALKSLRCKDRAGKCYDIGDRLNNSCCIYECAKTKTGTGFLLIQSGCQDRAGNCYNIGDRLTASCCIYECVKKETGSKFVQIQSGCSYHGKCYDAGSVINDTERCLTYKCQSDGKPHLMAVGCSFQGVCHPANKDFQYGCSTFTCVFNGKQRYIKHKELACKAGHRCIPAGQIYEYNCNTYKCSEDKLSCKSVLLERGCKDSQTHQCADPGAILTVGCANYVCQPSGTSNPLRFHSGECSHEGTCFPVGGTVQIGDCSSIRCGLKDPNNPSKGLVKYSEGGCVINGQCRQPGYKVWDKTSDPHYCKQKTCYNGQLKLSAFACRDLNNHCIEVQEGEKKPYKFMYNGRECNANCYRESNQWAMKDVVCS